MLVTLKKNGYDTKIKEIESKYVSNTEVNSKLVQANLVTKTDFDDKLSNLNRKLTKNKADHVLVQNELNKLKTFDSSYYISNSYFEEDGTPNYLIFQPIFRYFKFNNYSTVFISSWKSRGLTDGTTESHSTSNISPMLDFYDNGKLRVNFIAGYLKQLNRIT